MEVDETAPQGTLFRRDLKSKKKNGLDELQLVGGAPPPKKNKKIKKTINLTNMGYMYRSSRATGGAVGYFSHYFKKIIIVIILWGEGGTATLDEICPVA